MTRDYLYVCRIQCLVQDDQVATREMGPGPSIKFYEYDLSILLQFKYVPADVAGKLIFCSCDSPRHSIRILNIVLHVQLTTNNAQL